MRAGDLQGDLLNSVAFRSEARQECRTLESLESQEAESLLAVRPPVLDDGIDGERREV